MQDDPIKLLLVEDEPLSCKTAQEMLRQSPSARFEVTHLRRLGETLDLLEAKRFDVILMDLSLPDQQGLATFRSVHARAPSLPIVILTGSADESLAFQAVREGAQDYIMKGELDGKMLPRIIRYAIERKHAEQALRQSEEFFRLITENVSDLIAVLDKDGNRLYNSPSYQRSLGNADTLEGTNSFKEIHPEDKEKVSAIFKETIKTGAGQRAEYRMLLTDGSVRHIESQGSAVRDETGKPAKVIVVSRDITERKQQMEALETALSQLKTAHEDLKTAQMRLIESEKLEAVSTFAGGIAHEVKNPLQTITLGIDFLTTCIGESDPNAGMVLEDMSSAAKRADGVIRGLVEFSSYNKRDVRDHDLSDIVEQALRSVENELTSRSIRLLRKLAADLPRVQLDLKTMKHVLLNFLMSAIESMSRGGILSVKTYSSCLLENQGWSGRTPGQLKAGDTIVVAEVEDNGTGVIESKLAESSERDFPTEMIRKGILDLMVLKKVVELYGGMIQILNLKEGGVRVTIMFKVT
jgi:PAS domain S-box-containing protein